MADRSQEWRLVTSHLHRAEPEVAEEVIERDRKKVGDENFYAMLRGWVRKHRGSNQDRTSFVRVGKAVEGKDVTALAKRWLDSKTTPTAAVTGRSAGLTARADRRSGISSSSGGANEIE